jgi:hypothetical protein
MEHSAVQGLLKGCFISEAAAAMYQINSEHFGLGSRTSFAKSSKSGRFFAACRRDIHGTPSAL